jgi:hypothetical protein
MLGQWRQNPAIRLNAPATCSAYIVAALALAPLVYAVLPLILPWSIR